MPPIITRLVPQAILLAVVFYWSWPSLQEAFSKPALNSTQDKKKSAIAQFSAATLSPTFPPPPTRDLFGPPGQLASGKGKSRGPVNARELAEKVASDAKGSGLVLNATCIMGQQRLAMINGRVYREKEVIEGQGEDPISWVVTDILPHKVFLSCQGMPLQLNYSDASGKRSAAAKPSPADKNSKKRTR
jgi:hypothetical protein